MALYYANQFISKTLVGAIDDTTTTITVSNSTGLETSKPGIACITWADPLDTSVAEYVTYTSISANVLQGVARGAEGFTAKSHSNGAVIAFPVSESHINNINDKLTSRDATLCEDPNGNEIIKTTYVASAVNEVTVKNAATGNNPSTYMTGGDSNIGWDIKMKGTGAMRKPTVVGIQVVASGTNTSTGDGKFFFRIPAELNGMNLTGVAATVYTAGTTGTTDIQIRNKTDSVDILSTKLTIDSGETDSSTAATPAVIDTTKDDVVTGDVLAIDVDAVSTTPAKGLYVELRFELP